MQIRIGDKVRCFNNLCGVIIAGSGNTLTISDGNYSKDIDITEVHMINNSIVYDKLQYSEIVQPITQHKFKLDQNFEEELNTQINELESENTNNECESYQCCFCGHTKFELDFSNSNPTYKCINCGIVGSL